jgi:hypothetical protein
MKLCKDCRWIQPPKNEDAYCGHPRARYLERSAVTGKTAEHRHTCSVFRILHAPGMACGPQGDFFEAEDKPVGFV